MVNVLIAEDNPAYRRSLRQVLSGRFPFVRITETADGVATLHQALARHYDLIFMDVRLPEGNGLDLTRAIKAVFGDSIICVITSYDLPEYRDAALRNGADRFMVKDDSTGAEIVAMVESLLRARYRALIVDDDPICQRQLAALLSIRWPGMIVAEAASLEEGVGRAAALLPDLVLLDLELPGARIDSAVKALREANPEVRFIGMTTDDLQAFRARALGCSIDYFVPLGPSGYTGITAIVHALQSGPLKH